VKKQQLFDTAPKQETCVLVGIVTRSQTREQLQEYLDELAFLALTANAICLKRFHRIRGRAQARHDHFR